MTRQQVRLVPLALKTIATYSVTYLGAGMVAAALTGCPPFLPVRSWFLECAGSGTR